jgi:hypothetical protein
VHIRADARRLICLITMRLLTFNMDCIEVSAASLYALKPVLTGYLDRPWNKNGFVNRPKESCYTLNWLAIPGVTMFDFVESQFFVIANLMRERKPGTSRHTR